MNPYDAVPYTTYPRLVTHPDRLATMASLFGMEPPPVAECSVLEIGCGNGRNLIPMAVEMPAGTFTGIDLAPGAVAEADALIRAAELTNVRVLRRDILKIEPRFGKFDYIIAHGVYSWVPADVRDRLLAICRQNLAPNGVAYVSYNALPGCYIRTVVRDLLKFHVEAFQDPVERLEQARLLLELLSEIGPRTASFDQFLKSDLHSALERVPHGLYHDDLGDVNDPVYFADFVQHAARHRLQYLSEVSLGAMLDTQGLLEDLTEDPIRKEQYLDFLKMRRFRQTLLVHDEVKLSRRIEPKRMREFYISSQAKQVSDEEFQGPGGGSAKTSDAVAHRMFAYLKDRSIGPVPFAELVDAVRDEAALCEIVLACLVADVVTLHSFGFPFANPPGRRPLASPVARILAATETLLPNLLHHAVQVDQPLAGALLRMDGTRTLPRLAKELKQTPAQIAQAVSALGRMAFCIS